MKITVRAVEEYNNQGFLIYADNYPGAYVRGNTREVALSKFQKEMQEYLSWKTGTLQKEEGVWVDIIQHSASCLDIHDANSEVIFDNERKPLKSEEYLVLKELAIKSAEDFDKMYNSIEEKHTSMLERRRTFYGSIPRTAEEMYQHVKRISYQYFLELDIELPEGLDLISSRIQALEAVEDEMDYLENHLYHSDTNETWSLRKLIRRLIWHDRIHAKAMYRMACMTFGAECVDNPFFFSNEGIEKKSNVNEKTYEFDAKIKKVPDIDGCYIEFPYDVKKEFGKNRVKVHAEFDGISFQGSLVRLKTPGHIIGIRKDTRMQLGKNIGDIVHVKIRERE